MGITGLLPFLTKSSRRANIKEYTGQTVAIDAYCWLHKGAFSCADKLILNEPTSAYVSYCMKMVNMLLSHNVKPILVFDGRYLPAKSATERKRRENRAANREKGAELLRIGKVEEGRSYLRRSVDITHEMALKLIKECRSRNVDCIVAPYEADAQLAYLNIKNIAQVVITEDSDLLLFGCLRVLFKMDINGNGLLIEQDLLHLSMGVRHDNFSIDKFRYMCILSGCDYLPSLPGIGLNKACKFINRTSEQNIYEALLKLPVNLQMWNLRVTEDYRNSFIEADKTFKFQLVYDVLQRKQVPLNKCEDNTQFVGKMLDDEIAFQLAIGNLDPMTLTKVDDYKPDMKRTSVNRLDRHLVSVHHSIWDNDYKPTTKVSRNCPLVVRSSTKGITVTTNMSLPVKRANEHADEVSQSELSSGYLSQIYAKAPKKQCQMVDVVPENRLNVSEDSNCSPRTSPILYRKNPFALRSPRYPSSNKKCLGALKHFKLNSESDALLSSRYFSNKENGAQEEPKNKLSVLDKIDQEEHKPKIESRSGSDMNNIRIFENESQTGDSVLTPELKVKSDESSSSLIENELSKFSIKSESTSQEDCSIGNIALDASVNAQGEVSDKSDNVKVDNCYRNSESDSRCNDVEKNASSPSDKIVRTSGTRNNCRSDGIHESPYFRKSVSKLSPRDRRSKLGNPLHTCVEGKQQSLLTSFGFKPRPKIQSQSI